MEDFDWTVKLVLGSNEISDIQVPLLLLSLYLNGIEGKKTVSIELETHELERVLPELESALVASKERLHP